MRKQILLVFLGISSGIILKKLIDKKMSHISDASSNKKIDEEVMKFLIKELEKIDFSILKEINQKVIENLLANFKKTSS